MTDPVADLLTRIRNGYMVNKSSITVPHSKMKLELSKILKTHGYLRSVEVKSQKPQNQILLTLNYINRLPSITGIRRLSKPGRRLYIRSDKIQPVLSGKGLAIISTSRGLLTGKQAQKQSIGGELVCKVW